MLLLLVIKLINIELINIIIDIFSKIIDLIFLNINKVSINWFYFILYE